MIDMDILAAVFWSLLALSLIFTMVSLSARSWQLMALAAVCAAIFGIAALPSIGLFVLPVALAQAIGAAVMARRQRGTAS